MVLWHSKEKSLVVEIVRTETDRPLFSPEDRLGAVHVIPTAWFLRTLPLVGRRAFLVYLFLRSHDRGSSITEPVTLRDIARVAGIRSSFGLWRELRRLERARIVTPSGKYGRFVVTDPPLLTRFQRRYLALLASGSIPITWRGRALVILALLIPAAFILWLLSLFHRW